MRLALWVIAASAMAAAAWVAWSDGRHASVVAGTYRSIDADGRAALTAIADLRAAQQSYVAAGQGEAFWFARVSSLLGDINTRLESLRAGAKTDAAAAAIEDAAAAMQDFAQVDRRARDYTKAQQSTLASDLIYSDGFDLTRRAALDVDKAITAELTRTDAQTAALRRRVVTALAGAGAIVFLALLALAPLPRSEPAAQAVAPLVQSEPQNAEDRGMLTALDDFRAPVAAQPPPIDLDRVAAICSDLARVTDTPALPALLENAAQVLDAAGIVVWVADPDRRELMPILVQGYSPELAARMGTLARDSANLTAAAFRTGLLQTIGGNTMSNGAIAAPLVSGGGAVGVMAAEVRNGGEQRPQLLAAARIIAAQLATLVGPPAARAKSEAAG